MRILFITLSDIKDISSSGIYQDLLRCFAKETHEMYVISPSERRTCEKTRIIKCNDCTILKVKTGNIQKTNLIEKGISTVFLEKQLIRAVKKYFKTTHFDLVLYSTPPVTIAGVVSYVKKRDKAISYLMLKDIFPQNAVDLGLFKKNGIIYKYFRNKEKKLYEISDHIGCTSPENIRFIQRNNPNLDLKKLEICVNCMEPYGEIPNTEKIYEIRNEYSLPFNKKIFLYGGNLGKPQGIDFLINCLKSTVDIDNAYFLIVGAGTERDKIDDFIKTQQPPNVRLMDFLPQRKFECLAAACDVGMIFLNYKSTTPNTPSRLLAYTNAAIPVLAVTDPCTDVGKIIKDGKFGWHCLSNDVKSYRKLIEQILETNNWDELKTNSHKYLINNYTPEFAYKSVVQHMEEYIK